MASIKESNKISDRISVAMGRGRKITEPVGLAGHGVVEVFGPDGQLKQHTTFRNLITEVGDQAYGDAYAALHANATVSAPAAVTGMQLGQGTTAVAKTGAGATIVTYIAGSDKAISASFPASSLVSSKRQIQWEAEWAAGEATSTTINEVVLVTRTLDASAATEAQTIARGVFAATIDKGADDTLRVTWDHELHAAV